MTKYKIISGGALPSMRGETVIELKLTDAINNGWELVKFEFMKMTNSYDEVMGFALLKKEIVEE